MAFDESLANGLVSIVNPLDVQIDADRLAELTGGDLELVAVLLGDFFASTRIDLAALDASVVARDPDGGT